jgi:hypothetical protein
MRSAKAPAIPPKIIYEFFQNFFSIDCNIVQIEIQQLRHIPMLKIN